MSIADACRRTSRPRGSWRSPGEEGRFACHPQKIDVFAHYTIQLTQASNRARMLYVEIPRVRRVRDTAEMRDAPVHDEPFAMLGDGGNKLGIEPPLNNDIPEGEEEIDLDALVDERVVGDEDLLADLEPDNQLPKDVDVLDTTDDGPLSRVSRLRSSGLRVDKVWKDADDALQRLRKAFDEDDNCQDAAPSPATAPPSPPADDPQNAAPSRSTRPPSTPLRSRRGPAYDGLDTPSHDNSAPPPPARVRFAEIEKEAERRKGAPAARNRPPGLVTDNEGKIVPIRALRRTRNEEPHDERDSGSGSGDDSDNYSDTARTEAKDVKYKKKFDPKLQTQEEADNSDEEDFVRMAEASSDEEGRQKSKAEGQRKKSKRKGKGKAVDDGGGELDSDAEAVAGGHTRGPIPKKCKDEIIAEKNAYHEKLQAIASQYNRPLRAIRQLAGEVARIPRKKSMWNMYEQYHSRVGPKMPEDSKFLLSGGSRGFADHEILQWSPRIGLGS